MAIKIFKPTSPGRRNASGRDFSDLAKKRPERRLTEKKKRISGRNNTGRITMRRRGGGAKKLYRQIDFKRDKIGVPARVAAIEYDPNRSADIALLHYLDGEKRYILAPAKVNVNDVLISSAHADIKPGNCMRIRHIPVGTIIHAVELHIGHGAQIARSAGTWAQLMAKEGKYALLRLPSGEMRKVLLNCRATIGQVGNSEHGNLRLGKAGKSRWLGRRPKVRGVAMNPVDHPMGGGEGRSSGGRHPCTPWGVPTKGKRTRNNKKTDRLIVKRRK